MSISFARVAASGTTRAGTNVYSAYTPPTSTSTSVSTALTGQDVSDYYLQHIFTKPYLDAHTLSFPSWRYAYIFWFVLIGLFIGWSSLHQLRWRFGFIGMWLRKIGMRKLSFGGSISSPSSDPSRARNDSPAANKRGSVLSSLSFAAKRTVSGSSKPSKRWTTPTISHMVGLTIFLVLTFLVCYIGPDYVLPTNCMFSDTYCGFVAVNGDNATSQYSKLKRALESAGETLRLLQKRRPARYGWSPLTDPLLSGPNYEIDKNYWASGNRVGLIAYAMLPLGVSLALKQWPMNIFATPFLTNLSIDKTALWHRWIGRIIWILSTVHTGLWTKQLFIDLNPFNEPTFKTSFAWHRLLAGAIAYGFLTALAAFSFKPLGTRFYEIFYYSHVAMALGFLVAIIIHYQALQGWCLLAACLWGLERLVRFCIFVFLNYAPRIPIFGEGPIGRSQFTSKSASSGGFTVHNVEKRFSADSQKYAQTQPDASRNFYGAEEWSAASRSTHNLQDTAYVPGNRRSQQPVYAFGPGNDDERYNLPHGAGPYQHRPAHMTPSPSYSNSALANEGALIRPMHRFQTIPKGYALAQILPGRVVKLTLHTPRHLSWKAGQHVQLTIPSARWWESHPYTISNAQNFTEQLLSTKPAGESRGGSEMILLISARRGFTKHLYQSIVNKRKRLTPPHSSLEGKNPFELAGPAGVLIRAQTYLPTGSASRAHWDDFSTVVLVAAGTGITYALSVLEHLCYGMAAKEAALRGEQPTWAKRSGRKTKPTSVGRIRFVWVMREYAHLSWVAPMLRRCLDISDPARLRIDLFVTSELQNSAGPGASLPYGNPMSASASRDTDVFRPPRPEFSRQQRNGSMDSMSSDTVVGGSQYSAVSLRDESTARPIDESEMADFSVTDMVLFDGEAERPTAADLDLSTTIRREGRLRRAVSRKVHRPPAVGRQPARHESKFSEDLDEQTVESSAASTPMRTPMATPGFGSQHAYPPFAPVDTRRPSGYDTDSLMSRDGHVKQMSMAATPLLGPEDASAVDLDMYDRDDLNVMAELARGGKPDLPNILDQEVERSQGKIIVGTCGPPSLNDLMRRLVSKRINPSRVAKGDSRGHIEFVSEEFYA